MQQSDDDDAQWYNWLWRISDRFNDKRRRKKVILEQGKYKLTQKVTIQPSDETHSRWNRIRFFTIFCLLIIYFVFYWSQFGWGSVHDDFRLRRRRYQRWVAHKWSKNVEVLIKLRARYEKLVSRAFDKDYVIVDIASNGPRRNLDQTSLNKWYRCHEKKFPRCRNGTLTIRISSLTLNLSLSFIECVWSCHWCQ